MQKKQCKKEVKEQVLNQMIDRIVSLNANLTESEVKDLVADRYLVIRNKKYSNTRTNTKKSI